MGGEPRLPIKLGPCSNGEFLPPPPSPVVREAVRRAAAMCDENARRLGMSRRRFLASTMGAATTLLALAACSEESGQTGGTFTVPPSATTEPTVADSVVGGSEPIVDVQTHLLEFDAAHPPAGNSFGSGFPQAACGEAEWWQCFSVDHWMEKVFLESDTTLAVISAVPVVADPDPLSIEVMENARRVAEQLCGDGRVVLQGHAAPNVGPLEAALDEMAALAAAHSIGAWKVYTHYGDGWMLDDDRVGAAFLAKVEELAPAAPRIVSVHKGLSGGDRFASPVDIGPAAAAHPDVSFVVYHSGYESGNTESAYSPDGAGADRLVRTLADAGIAPGGNVYAELGSTWRTVMGSPDEAAHLLGKLLAAVGPDNILWGTDSIWYGSPQDQIQAFRAFEITPEFQERFGYPALTPEVKAKIFGGNAARLYGLDPATAPCRFSRDELAGIREEMAVAAVTEGPVTPSDVAATFARDHPWF